MDKCPMCGYKDPSLANNPIQTAHMNKYVVDSLDEDKAEASAKIINSNERYLTLKEVLHRRSDLPKGAPNVAEEKKKANIPQAAPSNVKPLAPASPVIVTGETVVVPPVQPVQTFVK